MAVLEVKFELQSSAKVRALGCGNWLLWPEAARVELLNGSQISKQSDLWLTLQEVISFNFQAAWASAAAHFSDN